VLCDRNVTDGSCSARHLDLNVTLPLACTHCVTLIAVHVRSSHAASYKYQLQHCLALFATVISNVWCFGEQLPGCTQVDGWQSLCEDSADANKNERERQSTATACYSESQNSNDLHPRQWTYSLEHISNTGASTLDRSSPYASSQHPSALYRDITASTFENSVRGGQ
jgi:hypothetical protein